MKAKAATRKKRKGRRRYGIAEWYGKSFVQLNPNERRGLAQRALARRLPDIICPFRSTDEKEAKCSKKGGVCSFRLYQESAAGGAVPVGTSLATLCPHRFKEADTIYRWIGQTLLSTSDPLIAGEIGFLQRALGDQEGGGDGGGELARIDNVLVHPRYQPLHWCALEIQAVYFSGPAMADEFKMIGNWSSDALPWPSAIRRPDYRSSGPKRLMPQLQIKAPSLRRWGKKMAVVVDRNFFDALGAMDAVSHVSNCDVAWFIVKYREMQGRFVLEQDEVRLTTLERAVEGLTGGQPVSLATFEDAIRVKLAKQLPAP